MVTYSWFTHWKWWFSKAMLVYQRVSSVCDNHVRAQPSCPVYPWVYVWTAVRWPISFDVRNRNLPLFGDLPGSTFWEQIASRFDDAWRPLIPCPEWFEMDMDYPSSDHLAMENPKIHSIIIEVSMWESMVIADVGKRTWKTCHRMFQPWLPPSGGFPMKLEGSGGYTWSCPYSICSVLTIKWLGSPMTLMLWPPKIPKKSQDWSPTHQHSSSYQCLVGAILSSNNLWPGSDAETWRCRVRREIVNGSWG